MSAKTSLDTALIPSACPFLSVSWITQKDVDEYWWNYLEGWYEDRQVSNSLLHRKHRWTGHVLRHDGLLGEGNEGRMTGKPTSDKWKRNSNSTWFGKGWRLCCTQTCSSSSRGQSLRTDAQRKADDTYCKGSQILYKIGKYQSNTVILQFNCSYLSHMCEREKWVNKHALRIRIYLQMLQVMKVKQSKGSKCFITALNSDSALPEAVLNATETV